ncbi:hypothetical protein [Streptomyces sp. NPDC001833]|uniref:hypothetical protein n=1 Tax=Streptomyces sp. NPDC001833 TaxID=3154658 RepID=UPI00332BB8FC
MIGSDGHPNYLLPILRELIPAIRPGRVFLLVFDDGLAADYLLLDWVPAEFGGVSLRLAFSRVPVGGSVRSSRYGGWSGTTLCDLSAVSGTADRAAYRLGMRLYFAGVLHRRSAQPFRMPLLRRCVGRAARLLARDPAGGDGRSLAGTLSRCRAPGGYVDPYRLTTSLLGRLPHRGGSPAIRPTRSSWSYPEWLRFGVVSGLTLARLWGASAPGRSLTSSPPVDTNGSTSLV